MSNINIRLHMDEGPAKETSIPKEKMAPILKVGDKYFVYGRTGVGVTIFVESSEPSDVTSYFKGL